jgi:hypothetical protein
VTWQRERKKRRTRFAAFYSGCCWPTYRLTLPVAWDILADFTPDSMVKSADDKPMRRPRAILRQADFKAIA